jgi:hypothetical protein
MTQVGGSFLALPVGVVLPGVVDAGFFLSASLVGGVFFVAIESVASVARDVIIVGLGFFNTCAELSVVCEAEGVVYFVIEMNGELKGK